MKYIRSVFKENEDMIISIKDIKDGMKLSQDVHSKLGGVLYKKGTKLKNEDKEILLAFGVENVEIEEKEQEKEKTTPKVKEKKGKNMIEEPTFTTLFNQALKIVNHIYRLAQGTAQIPIVELRKALQPLLVEEFQQLKYFSKLKFATSKFSTYDSYHGLSVGIISHAIGTWIGIEKGERMQLALAGVLLDIGMNRIPTDYYNQTGPLNEKEFEEIKKHTLYGYHMIKDLKGLTEGAKLAVLQHHEREDGSGYPLQLKKDQIHLYAKIIAVADIFHAMMSRRSYREEYSIFQVIDQMMKDSFGKLDPTIVRVFANKMTQIANGMNVLLNNGREGTIVFIDQHHPTRPWVKVDNEIINLVLEKDLYIKDLIIR